MTTDDTGPSTLSPAVIVVGGHEYMRDRKERLVFLDQVKPTDKIEDDLVRRVLGYADDLSARIARFKGHCFDDIGAFMALLAEKYDTTVGAGTKGNMTFTSYDGTCKVQVAVADRLTFGPELQVAKALIDQCLAEWMEGSRAELRALIERAFQTDKAGQVSREAIFSLRRVEIDDDRWRKAMEAIGDSIRIEGSKTYLRFYRRARPTDNWTNVTIDLASAVDPRASMVRPVDAPAAQEEGDGE